MAFINLSSSFLSARPASTRPPRACARRAHTPRAQARKAQEVSAEQLELMVETNERPLVIDAFAQWCGPCQFLLPQLDIVAERFGDALDILKLDTEVHPDLASALMVRGYVFMFLSFSNLKIIHLLQQS